MAGKVRNACVYFVGPDGKRVGVHAALHGCKTTFYIHREGTENLAQTSPTCPSTHSALQPGCFVRGRKKRVIQSCPLIPSISSPGRDLLFCVFYSFEFVIHS